MVFSLFLWRGGVPVESLANGGPLLEKFGVELYLHSWEGLGSPGKNL
jgi:hypothetical protein